MGREIRRVPQGWQHPTGRRGFKPLLDEDFDTALTEWLEEKAKFESDGNAEERARILAKWGDSTFEAYHGGPPSPEYHRPKFDSEPTHYQIYETVSEGTPTSPVFETLDEMKVWLIKEGFSEHAASTFVRISHAPSMVFTPGLGVSGIGIHSLDHLGN